MADVVDISEAKKRLEEARAEAAREVEIKQAQKKAENFQKQAEKIVEQEYEGINEFGALLMLDDEHFQQIAPLMLEQIEQRYSTPEVSQQLYYSFKANGGNIEELDKFYDDLIKNLTELQIDLSPIKMDFLRQMVGLMVNTIQKVGGEVGRSVRIPVEFCHEDAKMPTYANDTDAGMDVYALEDVTIAPGETVLIPTGIKMAIPKGYEIQVRPKSGRASRTKLRVANTPGTIDSGYRDEIKVIIENIDSPIKDIEYEFDENGSIVISSILHNPAQHIGKGEKFAQLVLNEVPKAALYEVDKVPEVGNRGGGFGSSSIYAKDDLRYKTDVEEKK